MKPVFFDDVEVDLVACLPVLLTTYAEMGFQVSTLKQNTTSVTQYVVRSDGGEMVNNVLKAENIALAVFVKAMPTENESYAEGKRLARLLEGILPMLPKFSSSVSYVEDLTLNVNDFNSVSQIYTITFSFTAYIKGKNQY